jgi:molecular chaperone DnaJ
MSTTCNACDGTGKTIHPSSHCGTCRGEGRVRDRKQINVNIPQGINQGMKIRLSGLGHVSPTKRGPSGDLLIEVVIEEDPVFKREGSNVLIEAKVPLLTALVGGTVRIPTIDGDVDLKIPAGTQSEDKKVLRNRGIQKLKSRERGDQWVTFKIDIPKQLTSHQKALLTEALGNIEEEKKGFFQSAFDRLKKGCDEELKSASAGKK